MIRKSLFWGLTIVLLAALVNLIIRGRRLEKQQAAQAQQTVQQSKPSPTRVLSPQDLEIVNRAMPLDPRHTSIPGFEIRNDGSVAYSQIQLKFSYLDRRGKVLLTKNHLLAQTLKPGATLKVPDLPAEGIPADAVSVELSISHADIGPAPTDSALLREFWY